MNKRYFLPAMTVAFCALTLAACMRLSPSPTGRDLASTAAAGTLGAQMTGAAAQAQNQAQTQTAQAHTSVLESTESPAEPTATTEPTAAFTITPSQPTDPPPPPKSGALPGSTAIVFIPGGTSMFFQDPIRAGEEDVYTLRAAAGQTMIVGVASPDLDVYLEITGIQNGEILLPGSAKAVDWHGTLPADQDYKIALTTGSADTYYFLSVEVPANIVLEPGASTAQIDGVVNVYTQFYPDVMTRVRYLVQVPGGKTLDAKLSSPNLDMLSMAVTGQQDGQPYLRYQVKNYGFYGTLPTTQGYYLDVYALGEQPVSFTLDIEIK